MATSTVVRRPLWRGFGEGELELAVAHAKSGGVAVVKASAWYLLGDGGAPLVTGLPLLIEWAISAVEAKTWRVLEDGAAAGLARAPIPTAWHERVDEWMVRDAAFDGSVAEASFDCVKCAACCWDNRVVLDAEDVLRLERGGRNDVILKARTKGRDRLLPLDRKTKACAYLGVDDGLMCSIYDVRPKMCREFPPGTEQCMNSREELYGSPFPPGR